MRKVASGVALYAVGAGIMLAAPDVAATDALTAMTIAIAVVIVLAVMGMLASLILRINRERNSVRVREIPPPKIIRVTAERVDIPVTRMSIAKARLPLGERGTNER